MVNGRRIFARAVSEMVALIRFHTRSREGLRILMYHAVGSRVENDWKGIFSILPKLFECQMAVLSSFKDAGIAGLDSACTPDPGLRIAVTFDDGYRDNLSAAAPILEKCHIPFTVFITTGFIQSGSDLYLNPRELRELAQHPLARIGSHCVSHVPLTTCGDRQLHDELISSKHYLEDLTGRDISTIAYPHGSVDRRVREAVEKAGYRSGASSVFGINTSSTDPLQLCRTPILGNDSLRIFKQKLHGDWDWCRWRQRLLN